MEQLIKGFLVNFTRSLLWIMVLVVVSALTLPPTAPAFVKETYQTVFCTEGEQFVLSSSGISRSAGFSFKCENSAGTRRDVTPLVLLVDVVVFAIVVLVIKALLRVRKMRRLSTT
jgi:hypothetical protein